MMSEKEMRDYDYIVECGIATAEELNLAFNLVGNSWTEVFNKVVDIRTGYSSLESYIECEMDDFDEEP